MKTDGATGIGHTYRLAAFFDLVFGDFERALRSIFLEGGKKRRRGTVIAHAISIHGTAVNPGRLATRDASSLTRAVAYTQKAFKGASRALHLARTETEP